MTLARFSKSLLLFVALAAGCKPEPGEIDDGGQDAGVSPQPVADAGADGGSTQGIDAGAECPAGQLLCGSACVDPSNDPRHCGACGAACAVGDVCRGRTCVHVADCRADGCSGLSYCDLSTGECRPGCANSAQCPGAGEVCDIASHTCACPSGQHSCAGACRSNTSVETCGASCIACAPPAHATSTCDGTACGFACAAGFHRCGDQCLSNASPESCGGACTPCVPPAHATSTCAAAGTCDFTCSAGFHRCGAQCVPDTSTQTCGQSCSPCLPPANGTATCDGTSCGFTCSSGLTACASSCVDLQTNPQNCGGCGWKVPIGGSCVGGHPYCAPPTTSCGGECRDLRYDDLSCGTCGAFCSNKSPRDKVCRDGLCNPVFRTYRHGDSCREICANQGMSCTPVQTKVAEYRNLSNSTTYLKFMSTCTSEPPREDLSAAKLFSVLECSCLQVAPAGIATYDSTLKAPRCGLGPLCDSGTLTRGRGPLGPEPHAPNTLNDSCSDGLSGTYETAASIERVWVETASGGNIVPGSVATVIVKAYIDFLADRVSVYYAANANAPVWVLAGTATAPSTKGYQGFFVQYTVPAGALQAVRAVLSTSTNTSCPTSSYDEADDLIFATQ